MYRGIKGEREMNVKLANHLHVFSRLRMRGSLATPPYFFMNCCLGKHNGNYQNLKKKKGGETLASE
jgi:hypothetical protein